MSGDGAGIIIGGILLLGALPYIVGGAIAVGAAYGTVKIGSKLIKSGMEHHQSVQSDRERQQQIEVHQCSAELTQMYGRMQQIADEQRNMYDQQRVALGKSLQKAGENLATMLKTSRPSEAFVQKMEKERQETMHQMMQTTAEKRREIQNQTEAMAVTIISQMQSAQETQAKLVNWKEHTANAVAMQRAQCQIVLRDAIASAKLLGSLSKSYIDPVFTEKAKRMIVGVQKAQEYFNKEMYELCAAESQNIVIQSARLTMEKTQQDMERDELRTELVAKLEGLLECMMRCRYVDFVDDYADRKTREDLNDYCQGEYAKLQALLEQRIAQTNATDVSAFMLQQMEDECDNILMSNVSLICETARTQLLEHYEKLRMMETIADFMISQNYELEWACNPGDDPSQKLSVRFTNRASNNSVVFTLDNDTSPEKLGKILMDMHIFYENNRPMTEKEKQTLRDQLVAALEKAGLSGNLSCSGGVNQPSSQTGLLSADNVRNQQVVPLFDQ